MGRKLYIVGLGPGDPDLITVKGLKRLEEAEIIFTPTTNGEGYALSILKKLSLDHKTLAFEVVMGSSDSLRMGSERICEALKRYSSVALAVLGEPSLYSTAMRILSHMSCRGEVEIEIVPGVSAVYACVDRISTSLAQGSEAVAIVPSSRVELLENAIQYFDTVVVVKGGRNLARAADKLVERGYVVTYMKHCFLETEEISDKVSDQEYMALVVAWRKKR
ncbi:MAG: precorrin-2 C(20)-methyltransferase [Ignisphaera sp.]|nr:precorrin-2 C(20)-methyltransferase [Ignisphaera sp.]MDW8086345.1 precorrin-2 C(20)-methyltransferase [Ignisphaera sp.]